MKNAIHMLCALSLFCALALNLTPEGRERRIMSFVCSVVLLASVFKTVKEPDWEFYALEKGQLRQREQDFLQQASGSIGMTFQDFIELYLKDMEQRLKPSTVANKRFLIDLKITP